MGDYALWLRDTFELMTYDLSQLGKANDPGAQFTGDATDALFEFSESQALCQTSDNLYSFNPATGTRTHHPFPPDVSTIYYSATAPEGGGFAWTQHRVQHVGDLSYYSEASGPRAVTTFLTDLTNRIGAADVLASGDADHLSLVSHLWWKLNAAANGPGMLLYGNDQNSNPFHVMLQNDLWDAFTYQTKACTADKILVAAGQENHPIFKGLDTTELLDLATNGRGNTTAFSFSPDDSPPQGWTALAYHAGDCDFSYKDRAAIVEFKTDGGSKVILDGAAPQEAQYADWSDTRWALFHNELKYLSE